MTDIVGDAQTLHPDRKIHLDVDQNDTLIVSGDALRLEQVVVSLLDNALIHAGATAAIRVRCSLRDDIVVIEVADDGCGIAEENLHRVFERLY